MAGAEDELENFRREWRAEVARKPQQTAKGRARGGPSQAAPSKPRGPTAPPPSALSTAAEPADDHDDADPAPRTFHDLPDKEEHLKLGNEATRALAAERPDEPQTALEHYEQAVEHEADGRLGDSVSAYRKAFKLDDRVHEQYKKKHFPQAPKKPPAAPAPPLASGTAPAHPPASDASPAPAPIQVLPTDQLISSFASLEIARAPPPTDLSDPPPCPIAALPDEVLVAILQTVAVDDVALFTRLAQVCKRLAYLVATENSIWRPVVLGPRFGVAAMHYHYAVDLRGTPLLAQPRPVRDLTPAVYPTHRQQFRHRARLRFNGVYISTVNYQRPGQGAQSRSAWNNPIHIVTYYRYLRFFRDGTAISLLTTAQPPDVVHHLLKEHLHRKHPGGLPSSVMKDALHGRWRLSGPAAGPEPSDDDDNDDTAAAGPVPGPGEYAREPATDDAPLGSPDEPEGDVHVETDGVVPKYMWKMQFGLANAGRKDGPRNNKLVWKGFWYYNHLTDDWGEFGLKNDKPFYFSRVKSYGFGEDD